MNRYNVVLDLLSFMLSHFGPGCCICSLFMQKAAVLFMVKDVHLS